MDDIYPFLVPIIMTDAIYVQYGGNTGSATVAQRQAAYQMAEEQVSDVLETYLLPVVVTGTFAYSSPIVLDHTYIQGVHGVQFLDAYGDVYWSRFGDISQYISLRDNSYGLVDLISIFGSCNCQSSGVPDQIQIMYTAGLPTGTASHPNILLALTTYAQIIINEIIGFGNEAPGDIGLQSFRNQGYSEQRVGLFKTALGSSPKAHFANRLLAKYKHLRYVGL